MLLTPRSKKRSNKNKEKRSKAEEVCVLCKNTEPYSEISLSNPLWLRALQEVAGFSPFRRLNEFELRTRARASIDD